MTGSATTRTEQTGAWTTLRRGLRLSPELRVGLAVTLLLALVATAGRVIVPITVQQVVDRALLNPEGVDLGVVLRLVAVAVVAVAIAAAASSAMSVRLATVTETALSGLRVRAFRHIHDLSMLHHAGEHRGGLVARVTSDIDQISQFMQWGGLMLLVNGAQLLIATVVMMVYSLPLTLVVVGTFVPMVVALRYFQRRLEDAYDIERERLSRMLTLIGESVVGAEVVRAYGLAERTERRIAQAVERHFSAAYRAARIAVTMSSQGEVFAAAATALVVVAGVLLGLGGYLAPPGEPWVGRLLAFTFLITLFVSPVQLATEVLDQAQSAISGWRRVLDVLDTAADVADPGDRGTAMPPGPVAVDFVHVDFRYPRQRRGGSGDGSSVPVEPATLGAQVLFDVNLSIAPQSRVAIVGETGSGKTTFAKLLTRLMDTTSGQVLLGGVDIRDVPFADLRRRVVMVPQDGMLFDTTVAENVRHGRPGISDEGVRLAFTELGLADWLEGLPAAEQTRVGERGTLLSVGERQLVALARAYVANPDLLVLDEATSAVDPATEVRIQRALEGLTRGRTAISIAHRLSTAETAEEVIVFDEGRVVQRGTHEELVRQEGTYAVLHASWARHAQVSET